MSETLYIIDGHSQIYRAYYAPFRDLTSPTGEPTRATYVFCSMLLKFIHDRKPKYLAMAADGPRGQLQRTAIYPDYKATRAAMPEDLRPQVERIMQIVRMMGIAILQIPGYEADDVIATLAHKHAGANMDVVVISRDKDLDQILGPHVVMYDPMKDQTFDAAAILAEKGYGPGQAVEVQSLMGDNIDNVPGIPGVGPKTAARLIAKYGTAEAVLAHADEQTPKLRDNLIQHAANVALARKLVTLDVAVPMDMPLEALALPGWRGPELRAIFAELGFNRLLEQLDNLAGPPGQQDNLRASHKRRVPGGAINGDEPQASLISRGGQGSLFGPPAKAPVQPQVPAEPIAPSADSPAGVGVALPPGQKTAADFDYALVDTVAGLEQVARELAGVAHLAVDTETTGSEPMWCELVGISLAWKAGHAVYIPIKGPLGSRTVPLDDVKRLLGPALADPKIEKIGQNFKYDLIVLTRAGFAVAGKFFDTMVAAHVLDSMRMSYSLGSLAAEFLNQRGIPIEDLIGRGKKQITMDMVDTATVAVYSGEDADCTLRLAEIFRAKMADEGLSGLFADLEMPLLPVLAKMEQTGIIVDAEVLKRMEAELSRQADALRERVILAAGRPFNPDSPKQLAEVLFGDLKLPRQRKTKTGLSTDSDVLEQLAVMHELPALVLDYRKLTKLIGTYLTALARCIHPRTGRVHTDFHQVGTATGRLSSSDPNLQNIPIRSEEGRAIRSAFVAEAGFVLLSADYSQVELRVLAHLCQDPTLIAAFAADQDIHRIVAAEVFSVPLDQVTHEQRAKAKTVNFGIIYGQTAYGLSLSLRIGRKEAQDFITRYRQRFPKIEEFLAACVNAAKADGYVETIFGRRRRIAEFSENASPNQQRSALAERLAINSVVQGSAADLIKQAMVNIARRIERENRPSRMLLQIHDELVFEVPAGAVESEREMIVHEMSHAIKLRVPLKVDTGIGANWMEAK